MAAVGVEYGACVARGGRVRPGARAGVQAVRIEDGAGFSPEDGEEAPDLGEEAGGGRGALCRRADGFPLRLGCRVGREEEGEDDQGKEGAEETLGELGHCDLLGPHGSGHHGWRGRASKREGAAERMEAGAQRLARARGLHVEVDAFLPYPPLPGKSWAGRAVDTDRRRRGALGRAHDAGSARLPDGSA